VLLSAVKMQKKLRYQLRETVRGRLTPTQNCGEPKTAKIGFLLNANTTTYINTNKKGTKIRLFIFCWKTEKELKAPILSS
jgi:hypothetical protein